MIIYVHTRVCFVCVLCMEGVLHWRRLRGDSRRFMERVRTLRRLDCACDRLPLRGEGAERFANTFEGRCLVGAISLSLSLSLCDDDYGG